MCLCCHFNSLRSALLLAVCVFKLFVPPVDRHPAHPLSAPVRHPKEKTSVVTRFETDIYASQVQQFTGYVRGVLTHVVAGVFSWSMTAGLVAFSSRQFAPTINQSWGPLSASHHISIFPSEASAAGRGAKRLEHKHMYRYVGNVVSAIVKSQIETRF